MVTLSFISYTHAIHNTLQYIWGKKNKKVEIYPNTYVPEKGHSAGTRRALIYFT